MSPGPELSPPAPTGAVPGPDDPRGQREAAAPAFTARSTLLYGVALLLLSISGWGALATGDPVYWLARPGDSAARLSNRDVLLAETAETIALGAEDTDALSPDGIAELRARLRVARTGSRADALSYAIAVHDETLESLAELDGTDAGVPGASDRVRAALSILVAEAGDPLRGRALAERMSDGGAFAAGFSAAYEPELERAGGAAGDGLAAASSAQAEEGREAHHLAALEEAGLEEWMLARPSIRLLSGGAGESSRAAAMAADLFERGERLNGRLEMLRALQLGVVILGLGILLTALWRSRGRPPTDAPRAPPWLLADGIGVLLRGELWGRLYYSLALASASWLPASLAGALHDWGGLLSALPLLWLTHQHLLSPRTGRAPRRDPLGLAPRAVALSTLIGVTLAALAVDLSVSEALGWLSWHLGVEGHWAEGFDESLAFDGGGRVLLTASSFLIWAPIFEELAYRGLLYFSLRRRLAQLPAALLSAAVFGLVHFYSLPGFLVTFWSGFVWALAFERARSLWPCVIAHALYNATFVAWMLLVYR